MKIQLKKLREKYKRECRKSRRKERLAEKKVVQPLATTTKKAGGML